HVSYGPIRALRGCALAVRSGEAVTVIGANGAGKTTLLRALSRLLPASRGRVLFREADVRSQGPHDLARAGMLHVPEGRGVLGALSVMDNLRIAFDVRPSKQTFGAALDDAFAHFPRLRERADQRAGNLSGGEQQMLALARAIVNPPEILLVDEPSLGLSPAMVKEAYRALRAFRARGMTILLVEQNVRLALRFADRAYVLKQGEIVASGASADLAADSDIMRHYLGSTTATRH
ncbi:MAG: ABC transporter ATP-binding protein, partial [Bradyrhizobium sp.]